MLCWRSTRTGFYQMAIVLPCDSHDERFAKLLIQTLPTGPRRLKQGNTQFQFEFQYPSRVTTMHDIQ
jgi:hypothetical protein